MAALTINFTAQEQTRIQTAVGSFLNLGRDAAGPEVKAHLIDYIKHIVRRQETTQNIPTDIEPT